MKRAAWAVLLGALFLLLSSSSASAAGLHAIPGADCKGSPVPEMPGRGIVGFFQKAPKVPPSPGNPWAPNSTTTIYEQYGYAGLHWSTYDLGCGPDLARNPDAVTGNAIANWVFLAPKAGVAATGALVSAAFQPDFLGVFDPLIGDVVTTMQHEVFERWAWLTLGALGVFVIWKSRSQALSETASAIGWALLIMVAVTVVFRWPLIAGGAADKAVAGTIGSVTAALNDKAPGTNAGTQATAGMHEALLYQTWLGGTFGSTDSDVAKKYGPVIFEATTYSWAEAKRIHDDRSQGSVITQRKMKSFEQAAEAIKVEDPDAYEYLTGRKSDTRVGFAVLAGLATLCVIPFLFAAGLLVIGALIIVRLGVVLFPGFAVLGMFPTLRGLVTGIMGVAAAALINATAFGIGAAVTVRIMGVLLTPDNQLAPWLQIILMLLLTIVMWVALRPFRNLTQMVSPGRNTFQEAVTGPGALARRAGRGALSLGGRVGMAALSGGTAGVAAGAVLSHDEPKPEMPHRAEAQSTPQPAISVTAQNLPPTTLISSTPPASAVASAKGRHAIEAGPIAPTAVHDPPPAPEPKPASPAGRYESTQAVMGETTNDNPDDMDGLYLVDAGSSNE